MAAPMNQPNKNGRTYLHQVLVDLASEPSRSAYTFHVPMRLKERIKDVECEVVEDGERKALPAPRPQLREGE
jgi:hypothetical protein